MARKTERVLSIRVPIGLPEELRARTGVPISTLARAMLIDLLNTKRKEEAMKQESPTDDQ